jgi:hypothetical protein
MGSKVFEVGIFDASRSRMENRIWDAENIENSLGWLKRMNAKGSEIYIRPWSEHQLSLVDDLSASAIQRMQVTGFEPAVVTETSPGNFQAWLNHGRVLPNNLSTAVARRLAADFGGDAKAADWRHYGRLAGFTNRKPQHQREDGKFPFVNLVEAHGQVYDRAEDFVWRVGKELDHTIAQAELRSKLWSLRHKDVQLSSKLKTIEEFRKDLRYQGDLHRADQAFAVYAVNRGVSYEEIAAAIGSRDLTKKGRAPQQEGYIRRTIAKARGMER